MKMEDIDKIKEKGWKVGMPPVIGNCEFWTTSYELSEKMRRYWNDLALERKQTEVKE